MSTLPWVCESGHPRYWVYRADGARRKVCHICAKIAKSASPRMCIRGHTFPVEERQCRLCLIYRQNPWLKELDEKGIATCPRGHEMTHDTLNYSTHRKRCCSTCFTEARQRGVAACAAHHTGKPNANRGKKYGVKKDFVDWVVVHRMINNQVEDVMQMKRGFSTGPTSMEKWVAYCSTTPMESAHRRAYHGESPKNGNSVSHMEIQRWESMWSSWGEEGRRKKWPRKTILDVLAEL